MAPERRKRAPRSIPRSRAVELAPQHVEQSIVVIRGHKVLLDEQLAEFYGVETKKLIQAMKRNIDRFPDDFMFQLTSEEWDALRCQIGTLDTEPEGPGLRSQFVTLKTGRGQHRKYLPYAFTEQGVAMLSGLLRSPRAVEVNIQIMRAFVRLRQLLAVHRELAERLEKIEQQMVARDQDVETQFQQVFALLERLFNPPNPPRKPIGFQAARDVRPGSKDSGAGVGQSSKKRRKSLTSG